MSMGVSERMTGTRDDPIVQLHVLVAEVKRLREDVVAWRDEFNRQVRWMMWGNVVVDVINLPGPFSLMEWDGNALHLRLALKIIARYSDYKALKDEVRFNIHYCGKERIVTYRGLPNQLHIDEMIIR